MKFSTFLALVGSFALGLCVRAQTVSTLGEATESRIRLVPQTSDTILADIAVSPDRKRLVTHDRNFAPRLWDAQSFQLLRVLGGAQTKVKVVRLSPDGKSILTLSATEARLWDSARARELWRISPASGTQFSEGEFANQFGRIALGCTNGEILLIDPGKPKEFRKFVGHKAVIAGIAFDSSGTKLASGDSNGLGFVWDISTGKPTPLQGAPNPSPLKWIEFSGNGQFIVGTSLRGGTSLWSADGVLKSKFNQVIGERLADLVTLAGAMFVGEGRNTLMWSDGEGLIHLIAPATLKEMGQLKGHTAPIREVRRSSNGMVMGTVCDDQKLIFWDITLQSKIPFSLGPITSTPTAGCFGLTSDEFWFGFADGSLASYDLRRKGRDKFGLGLINPIARLTVTPDGRFVGIGERTVGTLNPDGLSQSTFHEFGMIDRGRTSLLPNALVSASGNYFSFFEADFDGFRPTIFSTLTGEPEFSASVDAKATAWSPTVDRVVLAIGTDTTALFDLKSGKQMSVLSTPFTNRPVLALSADGVTGALYGMKDAGVLVVNFESGDIVAEIPEVALPDPVGVAITDDLSTVAVLTRAAAIRYDAKSNKILERLVFDPPLDDLPYQTAFPLNLKSRLVAKSNTETLAIDFSKPKVVVRVKRSDTARLEQPRSVVNRNGTRMLTVDGNRANVWNLDTGSIEFVCPTADAAQSAVFAGPQERILTADIAEGVTIWDNQPGLALKSTNQPVNLTGLPGKRLGSLVQLTNGSWLVMDASGRYDAPDPSDVRGALYVIEWDGGLEAVDVAQLKSLYWDPGLLQKLLGQSKEPLREVPSLDSLRLYPSASLEKVTKGVEVSVEERDGGGIGRVQVFVNGKVVSTKEGAGFFRVSNEEIQPFLLPQNRLPEGQGNLVSVKVTNAEGTLTSQATTLDIGVPNGLQAPPVNLYALFCGTGDYVGSASDLAAPPSDAIKLSSAVSTAAKGLLNDRIHITTLTTKSSTPDERPTHANILKWLDETASKATSSDIVIVFLAGHGIDQVGSARGYFYLTAEADPTALTEGALPNVSVSSDDLRARLGKISANKQVVILDTCHSGAASNVVETERSASGDYQRAWESLKDSTGSWLLAGSAADQRSYESPNVEHGVLTYSLLEALDRLSAEGLRASAGGEEMFVDVEKWMSYAVNRVESLKQEVGLTGVQKPELKRSKSAQSFDLGVLLPNQRGFLGLKPPMPIVVFGAFQMEQEDPVGLEPLIQDALNKANGIKCWPNVAKHPGVYRVAGEYAQEGDAITMKIFLQQFDSALQRKTLQTFEVRGTAKEKERLATRIREEIVARILKLEEEKKSNSQPNSGLQFLQAAS